MSAKFLQQVAHYYTTLHSDALDTLTFVLPNKRSAMFLKKYMRESLSGISMMPRFATIGHFVSGFSPNPEAPRRDLLFILYDAYRRVMATKGHEERVRDFDSFIFWGDMILNDFDDIDRSFADAAALFRNLRDVKEIQADYLDPEQKEIIRRIWGESRLTIAEPEMCDSSGGSNPADRFWLHLDARRESGSVSDHFTFLWEILGDLYREFTAELQRRGVSTQGMQYRSAALTLKSTGADELPFDTKYAFVGFNDISTAEAMIFDRLQRIGAAAFFWDGDSPTVAGLRRNFQMPGDFTPEEPDGNPSVEVIAVPSNIAQAKFLQPILRQFAEDKLIEASDPGNTAVVLPDEGLLMPVLFSIPEEIRAVNITMGVPYRTTTFSSLLSSVISMQLRARRLRGTVHFYYEDVVAVLNHPHILLLAGEEGDRIKDEITAANLYNIPAAKIAGEHPALAAVFKPVKDSQSAAETGNYMLGLVKWLEEGLERVSPNFGGLLEKKMIAHFRDDILDILRLVEEHGVAMSENTFFSLFERMFDSHQIVANGTPLAGLQVMGVLETRALDFDNVVILSMNERIFPRRQYVKSMIPNALRYGYGLPPLDAPEETYAYCFRRLLSRAKNVKLLYDSRSGNFGSGEMSRYISQLKYLRPDINISFSTVELPASASEPQTVRVRKNREVLAELNGFRPGGRLRLSASALKSYKRCPLQFYLQYVRNMRGSDELSDYVSASQYGTVVHRVIELLYTPYAGREISREIIEAWTDPANPLIDNLARREVYTICYGGTIVEGDDSPIELPAEGAVIVSVVTYTVRTMLSFEARDFCNPVFTFIESEMEIKKPWKIDDDLTVNFRMAIDRVDRDSKGNLRFVDFKTGKDEIRATSIESIFERGEHKSDAIFQVLTYCEAYAAIFKTDEDIRPVIYPLRMLNTNGGILPVSIGDTEIDSYRKVTDTFRPELHALIKEIFDPGVDFIQAADNKSCKFCPFLSLCGRTEP